MEEKGKGKKARGFFSLLLIFFLIFLPLIVSSLSHILCLTRRRHMERCLGTGDVMRQMLKHSSPHLNLH